MIAAVPNPLTDHDAGADLDRLQRDLMAAWVRSDRLVLWIRRNAVHTPTCGTRSLLARRPRCTCGLQDILDNYSPVTV